MRRTPRGTTCGKTGEAATLLLFLLLVRELQRSHPALENDRRAAVRELREETGIDVPLTRLKVATDREGAVVRRKNREYFFLELRDADGAGSAVQEEFRVFRKGNRGE